ncbi:aminotransferase class I/II-fold pyridoxal phosphate-dependent enzyme [Clostridium sp. B9]|uniref:aminotransferase class I/II-fold pyridoxal phosphate-dependent enzyme n=1 Tax=Clostridium sp. B9 TaxID=3423224 RepID=UPI003D2EFEEF
MKNIPIINGISEYLKEEIIPFSMPGHKMGRGFKDIKEILINGDLTEVDGLDNLQHPEGIIKEAEDKLTELYKSKRSYFLVNGSTCGNLIMIFSLFKEGDKILVERNCHKSIMNGIIMRKLKPIFINNIFHSNLKAPVGIDLNHLEKQISKNKDVKGIVLTYPNYYGVGVNIEKTIEIAKNAKLKIGIDSAHGAHFGFSKCLPKSVQELGADIVIMSAHKTLPSLTQTAWLHVNDEKFIEEVEFYKNIFMSTSPSYMFMMSLDYSRNFLEVYAEEAYKSLEKIIEDFKEEIKDIPYLKILDKTLLLNGLEKNIKINDIKIDESRVVINLKENLNGNKLLDYLREKKIQCEMSDNKNVVLIPSPFNTKNDFDVLAKALKECNTKCLEDEEVDFYLTDLPKKELEPFEVLYKEYERIEIDKTLNKIVAENIVPYPPGVPMLITGEVIEEKHIKLLKEYMKNGVDIIGIKDNKIKVVK